MPLTQVSSRLIEDTLRYVLGASGTNHYTFTGKGLNGAVNDPTLTLSRGHTYIFENRNSNGAHPFYIKTSIANGGTNDAYNTGVTNNGGAGGTEIVFTVPHDAPDVLYYQCSSHSSMAGQLKIAGAVADGSITESKLANGAVTTNKISDNQITSAKIVDTAVTLAKLEHGTSSNDGKFLRANNGADPSFETINTTPADGSITTAKLADNSVDKDKLAHGLHLFCTGSDKGIILQGNIGEIGDVSGFQAVNDAANANTDFGIRANSIRLATTSAERVRVTDNGLTFNGDTAADNALDDYEIGTFTPNIQDAASGGNSHGNSGVRQGKYVKIGSAVTVMIVCRSLSNSGLNGSHQLFITNLPFRQSGVERAIAFAQVQYFNNVSNTEFGMHFQINNNETIMRFFKMKDNQGANPAVTFNHWMYSSGYYGFSTTFTYITDQ